MYAYIPVEKITQLKQPYSIAKATDWQFERMGKKYGGVEDTEFSPAQKAEIISLEGNWFATGEEFGEWLSGKIKLNSFLFEVVVSGNRTLVCNLPILTGGSSFVLDVMVRDAGQPDRLVQLVCTNTTMVSGPGGSQVPEFDYLVSAIRSDAGLKTLTTQMLTLRNSQGFFNQAP